MNHKNLHNLFYIQAKTQPKRRLFIPNVAQRHYHAHMTKRDIILKARQLGFTTKIKMDDLNTILTENDTRCITIADTLTHAQEIFGKVRYAFDHLPVQISNRYCLDTNNTSKMSSQWTNSTIMVTTSGRSGTSQRLHVSELAHMLPHKIEEVITGSLETVPSDGYAVIESTAKGKNELFDMWKDAKDGKNEWCPHFYAWFWNPEYRVTPINTNWKDEYIELGKTFGLIIDIQKRFKLDDAQFYWYFLKVKSLKDKIKQEYPSTDIEAFLSSSSAVFNMSILQSLVPKEPTKILDNGELLIWEDVNFDHDYILAADASEGDINSDYCVGAVLDVQTAKQVAELRGQWKPSTFARKLDLLGRLYNNAMIAVERNNHGHAVLLALDETEEYPDLYEADDEKLGWLTSAKTKPLIIDGRNGLVDAINDSLMIVNSQGFIDEAFNFVYTNMATKKGMGAEKGYDDRIMAWAIAWYIRNEYFQHYQNKKNRQMVG